MAGLVTCLWQAFPEFTNMEIIQAVIKSSSKYNTPDDRVGYGIPDFRRAFDDLSEQRIFRNMNVILGYDSIKIFPNPFRDNFNVIINPEHTALGVFQLYDSFGKLYFMKQVSLQKGEIQNIKFDKLQLLQKGVYIIKFTDGQSKHSFRLLAQ
jgi:hypothetical protein